MEITVKTRDTKNNTQGGGGLLERGRLLSKQHQSGALIRKKEYLHLLR